MDSKGKACATILVVEDHVSSRVAYVDLLHGDGYRVVAPQNAAEAIDFCRAERAPVDVVLTELCLCGADGRELVSRVRQYRPGLAGVVYVTAYAETVPSVTLGAREHLLSKPVDFHRVEGFIDGLLRASSGPSSA